MERLDISWKIYLEGEDISQSRIKSTTEFVKRLLDQNGNSYLRLAQIDDESDPEEFALRLYVEGEVSEGACTSEEDAQSFVLDMVELLDAVAAANSYLDMEGRFSWGYGEKKEEYTFRSEGGQDVCEIEPIEP